MLDTQRITTEIIESAWKTCDALRDEYTSQAVASLTIYGDGHPATSRDLKQINRAARRVNQLQRRKWLLAELLTTQATPTPPTPRPQAAQSRSES